MHFRNGVKTFSLSEETKKSFEELDKIRPNNISFSSFLGIVANEYVKHKNINNTLDNFVDLDVTTPYFFSDIEKWKFIIDTSSSAELIRIQKRLSQIQNISDNRVRNQLC